MYACQVRLPHLVKLGNVRHGVEDGEDPVQATLLLPRALVPPFLRRQRYDIVGGRGRSHRRLGSLQAVGQGRLAYCKRDRKNVRASSDVLNVQYRTVCFFQDVPPDCEDDSSFFLL